MSRAERQATPSDATGPGRAGNGDLAPADPLTRMTGRKSDDPSSQRAPLAPLPGDRLDAFELERSIGVGGMGAVFLAIDTRLHREVALKILPPEQSRDSESVQRFYQEGRAAARLDHENIARVFTLGSDKGYHFIAFEYIEGATLRQRVNERGPLPVSEAINYTLQVAGALVHAAERGVVHRDIKPSNIIITPQGRAKLVDMGLARHFERGEPDDGLTQSGMTLGTFDYISPEQARDPRDVDVRGDLYSLGCTLFHMLTGRPPFPEGTVLQKLLQHQEEPPPDVRSLNPDVPPDLAAVLQKLMAKDRERRYQTPELLVRDLLVLAGSLGMRSMSPEGLVWMSPQGPPAWEKHLVWGLPAAALAVVVAMLVWWGQPAEPPALPRVPEIDTTPVTPPKSPTVASKDAGPAKGTVPKAAETKAHTENLPATSQAAAPRRLPREVTLKAGDDLAAAVAREASGSTLVLSDDGPYPVPPASTPTKGRKDLTLRAATDAHPVIVAAKGAAPGGSLLAFGAGAVRIEGVTFSLGSDDPEAARAAVRADGTDLTLRACSFRKGAVSASPARPVAIELTAPADADDPTTVRGDACHFDGGLKAVSARGAASVQFRDTTFGPDEPVFAFDNGGAAAPVAAELILKHVSIRPEYGPVIAASGTRLRAVVEDSVIAAPRGRTATLAEVDRAEMLSWRGKGNLYAGIGAYLSVRGAGGAKASLGTFADWADDPQEFRESLSMAAGGPVWSALAAAARDGADPSRSFALGVIARPSKDVGARRGPRGRIVSLEDGLGGLLGPDIAERLRAGGLAMANRPEAAPKAAEAPRPPESANPVLGPMPAPSEKREAEPVLVEPRPMDRGAEPEVPSPMGRAADEAAPPNDRPPIAPPDVQGLKEPEPRPGAATIRTQAAFLAAVANLGPRGGTLTLASDAVLDLPACEFKGPGRVILQAEEGPGRPLIRFRPEAADAGARRAARFTVRAGTLELRGVDVLLERAFAPTRGDWAAFRILPGAEVALMRCTVTVEGRSALSAVAFVPPADEAIEPGAAAEATAGATFRATDSLLRCGGDLIDVGAGRRLDAEFTNAVLASGGALIHGHGLSRGQGPEPLKLVLRQVSARAEGGIAYLETAPGEPDLPVADVTARDVVLTTDGDGGPLFRVDGQDGLDALKDRVRWAGQGVQYHRIDTYRRDQTARPGTLPLRFDRASWDLAVAPRDEVPFHGDAGFLKPWDRDRAASTLLPEDVKLDPEGPSSTAGPDLRRIPVPPKD